MEQQSRRHRVLSLQASGVIMPQRKYTSGVRWGYGFARYFIPESRSCYRDMVMVFEDVQGQQRKGVESARAIALRQPLNYPVWPS